MKRSFLLKRSLILGISIFIVSIDQVSKYFAYKYLTVSQPIIIISKVIQFNLVKNYGAAFSLFDNRSGFLGVISFIVSLLILLYILRNSLLYLWEGIGLAFLLGGSIGNGIDRWVLGYVNDFIQLTVINFPVFNLADVSINIGVICILLSNLWKPEARY